MRLISLDVPASLIAESEGDDATVEYVAYAANPDLLSGFGDAPPVLRKAVCRIPQTEAARTLLLDQLGGEATPGQAKPGQTGSDHSGHAQKAGATFETDPQYESGVIPGDFENAGGYVCPDGYDWATLDMTNCVNSFGEISLPVLRVAEDELDDDGMGAGTGENEFNWPDEEGELYTRSECLEGYETMPGGTEGDLCIPIGGSSPPTDPCESEDPPADCDPEPPCESDNPPEYCDEAGSCFDAEIENEEHRALLEAMEAQENLNNLWEDTNFGQSEINRAEQGGFQIPNGYDDGYTFQRILSSQITEQTPCKLQFQQPANIPEGTIYVHTHPYERGEHQDYCTARTRTYLNEVGVADRPALQQMGLDEGLIIDADRITFFRADGSSVDGYAQYDRCSY